MVLAEKILQKAYKDKKMEYNGEFLMYLNILQSKSKFTECLAIINDFDEAENDGKLAPWYVVKPTPARRSSTRLG